ncbi:MAG: hypothetical protein ABWY81_06130 [Jiangellaceae bacterium]
MTTYEQVHAGDFVLGYDNDVWGVAALTWSPTLTVELVKPGARLVGHPPEGTDVTVLHAQDVTAEAAAWSVLAAAGLNPEMIEERWTT